jgi:probable DNA metabolism protein
MIYIYDGSFQGLLSSIYDGIALNENPERIITKEYLEPELFIEIKEIKTIPEKADKVIKTISAKFKLEIIENVYYSFLSNVKDIEKNIFDYIKLSFYSGNNIEGYYANDVVYTIRETVRKVIWEKHKFLGLVRFRLLKDGLYYAPIEPDNNITALLITHFKKRLSNQKWLIHDINRGIGAYFNGLKSSIISIDKFNVKLLDKGNNLDKNIFDDREEEIQKLWKIFFGKITIPEKKNSKLQRQFIPIRYWKHLIEK